MVKGIELMLFNVRIFLSGTPSKIAEPMFDQSDPLFRDRHEAGRFLATLLRDYAGRVDVLVLALPRGGVPVGYEVAKALGVPLDIFMVRKLGMPGQEELAMGAIASGGVQVVNPEVLRMVDPERILSEAVRRELPVLERREREYRAGRPAPDLRERTVLLVDDGLATGATTRAAVQALRRHSVATCIVAVPVATVGACAELQEEAEGVICAATPTIFYGVGAFYEDFAQTTDEEVRRLLELAKDC
jgi:predicted phosphoribosyltransferase